MAAPKKKASKKAVPKVAAPKPAAPKPAARRSSRAEERRRRTPDEAKRTILAAALELFAHHGPDAIGLKDVASKAGVSHALVSHYFGTYDALVEAAFAAHLTEQRLDGLRRIAAAPPEPSAWLDVAFDHLSSPITGRLLIWAMLTGRLEREDFVVLRDRGLAQTVDLLEAYLRATGVTVDRAQLEQRTLVGLSAAIGYVLGRGALWGALGRRPSADRDAAFRAELSGLLLSGLSREPAR